MAEFLQGLVAYAPRPRYGPDFAARVFKISRDNQGNRLTWMKLTGGALRVKEALSGPGWTEKADQLRVYSGSRFQTVDEAQAGSVVAVTGLSRTAAGEGLGAEAEALPPALEPVLTYQVLLPEGQDPHAALGKLRLLEEEDPQLHLVWNERLREIHIQLMGEVQLEILQALAAQRFGLAITFGPGRHRLPETIAAPVEGVGHYEPLRHYAEVHLLLEPLPRGSGLELAAACPQDMLDGNWQRLVLTHLAEKPHLGVLTGSPITDVRITLVAGRAHLKHTEGGDFRQATYRRCARASWRRRASCWSRGTTSGWSCPRSRWAGPCPTSSAWRAGRHAGDRRGAERAHRLRPGGGPAGLWPGGGRLHPWPGTAELHRRRLRPLPQRR